MPTATGKPTAAEKREAERLANREARLAVTAEIRPWQWYEAEADDFVAKVEALRKEVEAGTKQSYHRAESEYAAGREFEVKVGRRTIKVDEGQAAAYGVADVLRGRGVDVHIITSFGLFAGRSTLKFTVTGR